MPKLFEYLGIIIYFYSNEHKPIHVHAEKDGKECKAKFTIINGEISEIKICNVIGKKPLKNIDLKNFKIFLENYSNIIIEKWIDYFIYNKEIKCKKITKRLK